MSRLWLLNGGEEMSWKSPVTTVCIPLYLPCHELFPATRHFALHCFGTEQYPT